MKHQHVPVATAVVLCFMGSSCWNGVPPAGDAWEKVLSSCGATDLNKSKPLYVGAANVNGVGSIWSQDAATGDYWPASQFKDITSVGGIVYDNTPLACKGEVTSGIEFKLGAGAKLVVYPVSADIQSTLNNAETAKVSVTSIVLQEAYWDKFNTELRKLPQNSPIMEGIQLNNRFVVGRAWKVKGFSAVLFKMAS